jgi:hypothetical protein
LAAYTLKGISKARVDHYGIRSPVKKAP